MCEVLMEIMKKDIDKKVAEGVLKGEAIGLRKGEAKGLMEGRIKESVVIYRDEMNLDNSSIISKIRNKFGLSQEAAEQYVLA